MRIENEIKSFLRSTAQDKTLLQSNLDAFYEKYQNLLPSFPSGEYKKKMMRYLVENADGETDKIEEVACPFYEKELRGIFQILQKAPTRMQGLDRGKCMFLCMIYKKQHYHESGWIRFSPEAILSPACDKKEIDKIVKGDFFSCLVNYGFDMRVIGSKSPTVCYTVPTVDFEHDKGEVVAYYRAQDWSICLRHLEELNGITN